MPFGFDLVHSLRCGLGVLCHAGAKGESMMHQVKGAIPGTQEYDQTHPERRSDVHEHSRYTAGDPVYGETGEHRTSTGMGCTLTTFETHHGSAHI